MRLREGDKVLCNACNRDKGCVGIIDNFNDWYGETVVTVYFQGPTWDHCDREVFYLKDLTPVRAKAEKALSATPVVH